MEIYSYDEASHIKNYNRGTQASKYWALTWRGQWPVLSSQYLYHPHRNSVQDYLPTVQVRKQELRDKGHPDQGKQSECWSQNSWSTLPLSESHAFCVTQWLQFYTVSTAILMCSWTHIRQWLALPGEDQDEHRMRMALRRRIRTERNCKGIS
jgi:hypothetical protein